MNKFFEFLCNIPSDKMLHYIAGMLIVAITMTAFPFTMDAAFLTAVVAGFAKEVYDLFHDGEFGWVDFVATILGGLTIQVLAWI